MWDYLPDASVEVDSLSNEMTLAAPPGNNNPAARGTAAPAASAGALLAGRTQAAPLDPAVSIAELCAHVADLRGH